jgi:hypothetical protein
MSVSWGVVPSQPEEPGFQEWLTSAGLEIPRRRGRFPTLEELMSVLQSFEGVPIQQEADGESSYSISLGKPYSEQCAYILGNVEDDHFQFHFYDSCNREITMMEILKRLAAVCGSLILYESIAATPVLIESSTNLEQALEDWRRRSRQRYSKDIAE